jgi:hypothetical protein
MKAQKSAGPQSADGKEFPQQGSERECKVVPGTTRCANGK